MKLLFIFVLSILALTLAQKTTGKVTAAQGKTTTKTLNNPTPKTQTQTTKTRNSTQGQTTTRAKQTSTRRETTTKSRTSVVTTRETSTTGKNNITRNRFDQWKKTNRKVYASKIEEENATKQFQANEKSISQHNSRKNETYKQGTNEDSDLSYEEKKATRMGVDKNVRRSLSKSGVSTGRFKRDSYSTPPPKALDFR